MAADQERADRIRQLKADHPEIRWRMVADHVGVTERAAQEWQKSGGIEPANAKKLAQLFGVSYEWLWFGREVVNGNGNETPDPFAGRDRLAQLEARIENMDRKLDLIMLKLGVNLPPAGEVDIPTDFDLDTPPAEAARRGA